MHLVKQSVPIQLTAALKDWRNFYLISDRHAEVASLDDVTDAADCLLASYGRLPAMYTKTPYQWQRLPPITATCQMP